SDHRIRIRTNMEVYWDYIFFAEAVTPAPSVMNEIEPVSADLHYRGFSASYRRGGRYGPHWFDYSSASEEPKWRDLRGNYTRYGDVLELLKAPDNKYIILLESIDLYIFSFTLSTPAPQGGPHLKSPSGDLGVKLQR
ncbi:MAG TPA: hypothetical protein VK155_08495, partial [Bacteroidales bacterium]|nr:hypothetical protein [Bacteroidales bacterium]